MKRFLKNIYRISRKNWFSLLAFEALYRVATSVFLVSLANEFIEISLKKQNYSYLTAENYMPFIKNKYTILLGLILMILMAFIILIEVEAVFSYFRYGMRNQKLYTAEMFVKGIKNACLFIKDHPFAWGIYIIGTLPFLCIHFLIREISTIKFLEYTVVQIYEFIPSKGILALLGFVICIVSTIFAFSLPYCILEKERILSSLNRAGKLLYKQKGKNIKGIIAIQLSMIVVMALVYLLSAALMVTVVMLILKPAYRVSGILYYGTWLKNALGILAGSLGIVLGIHYIGIFYISKEKNSIQAIREAGSGKRWFSHRKRRYISAFLTLFILVGEVGYLVHVSRTYSSISDLSVHTPAVTAHRGGALKTPENTMSAIRYSVESMSDFAEIDVQETKDHVIVLLHDTNLKRVTGLNKNIWELTYQEVSQLDAGVKFNSRFLGEQIPTLEEVIEYAAGKIKLNIEVKANGHNDNIVSKVVQLIQQYNFQENCVVTSMNYKFLQQVKALDSNIRTGYTMTMAYGSVQKMEAADFISVKNTYINKGMVEDAHAFGKEVHTWTVNYPDDIKRMISCGVDNIITDNPGLVHQVYLGDAKSETGFISLIRYTLK